MSETVAETVKLVLKHSYKFMSVIDSTTNAIMGCLSIFSWPWRGPKDAIYYSCQPMMDLFQSAY
jgi:hypothetical protein